MNRKLTIGERLKDLRVDRGLKLEQLAEQTGLSKSALGGYETEDNKDISHRSIVILAQFYGVSTDYLLGLTENKNHPNAAPHELHLSDEMIALLKSDTMNNRLLCEIVTHKDFARFLTDAEIYVDGIATMQIQNINAYLDIVRAQITEKYQPGETELYINTLGAARIDEDDYFSHIARRDLASILYDLRQAHVSDSNSASPTDVALTLKQSIEDAANFKGSLQEKQIVFLCQQLEIDYESLEPDEFRALIKAFGKSKLLKNPIPQRGKHKR